MSVRNAGRQPEVDWMSARGWASRGWRRRRGRSAQQKKRRWLARCRRLGAKPRRSVGGLAEIVVASTTAQTALSDGCIDSQMSLASEFATISLECAFSKVRLILRVFLVSHGFASRTGTASRARSLRSENGRGLAGRPREICRRRANKASAAPMPRQRSNKLHGRAVFRAAFLFLIVICF